MAIDFLNVIIDFHSALFFLKDLERASQFLSEDLLVENFFPHQGGKKVFMWALQSLLRSLPDRKSVIMNLDAIGNIVTMTFQVSGTHSEPLDFSLPKMPVLQPRYQIISWPVAQWEHTVVDGTIVRIRTLGSIETGMIGILRSFGADLPMRS